MEVIEAIVGAEAFIYDLVRDSMLLRKLKLWYAELQYSLHVGTNLVSLASSSLIKSLR